MQFILPAVFLVEALFRQETPLREKIKPELLFCTAAAMTADSPLLCTRFTIDKGSFIPIILNFATALHHSSFNPLPITFYQICACSCSSCLYRPIPDLHLKSSRSFLIPTKDIPCPFLSSSSFCMCCLILQLCWLLNTFRIIHHLLSCSYPIRLCAVLCVLFSIREEQYRVLAISLFLILFL